MQLSELVEESLSQILDGIIKAQRREHGANIAAFMYGAPAHSNIYQAGAAGHFTMVEFDVGVFPETREGGKPGIRVAPEEAPAGGDASKAASRVKFSVHLRLPQGAAEPPATENNFIWDETAAVT